MIVTKLQAQKIMCCGNIERIHYCVGSQCMAWRWIQDDEFEIQQTYTFEGPNRDPPEGDGWERCDPADTNRRVSWKRPWGDRRTGYCGLAPLPFPEVITTY